MMSTYNTTLQNNNIELQAILDVINELPDASGGVELPELSNEGTAQNLLNGKELIDSEGNVVTGTMTNNGSISSTMDGIEVKSISIPEGYTSGGTVSLDSTIDDEVSEQTDLIAQIKSAVNNLPEAGSGSSGESVEYSENEDAILTGTITEYTNDRIEKIKDYTFYSCTSLTTASFPACTSIGGSAFSGCSKLTTANFPVCTSIGSCAFQYCYSLTTASFPACTSIGGSAFSGCSKLTTANFPVCTNIGYCAFEYCYSLTTISFPVCTGIGNSAFQYCSKLTTVNFPECTSIGNYTFQNCSKLTTISFPVCTSIGTSAFYNCSSLTTASFAKCTNIGNSAFRNCRTLSSLTLYTYKVCTLANSNAFTSTPYAGYSTYYSGTPAIYVPSVLLSSYQTATNWTYFSSYFVGMDVEIEIPDTITFTIDGTEYQAEEGMTWGEWIDSDYNTDDAYSCDPIDNYIVDNHYMVITLDGIDYIAVSDIIVSNANYTTA